MRRDLGLCAAILATALCAYAPMRHNGFIELDDFAYILNDDVVRAPLGAATLVQAFAVSRNDLYWQPVTVVSLAVDHALFGFDPVAYHAENLAWHVATALLLFLGLGAATGARGRAAAVGALFAVHPLNVESVAWAIERRNVLAAFFGLAAVAFHVRHVRRRERWAYAGVIASTALSLAAKPLLLPLPAMLLAVDVWPLRRTWSRALLLEKLPLLASSVGVVALVLVGLDGTDAAARALDLRLANAALVPWRQLVHLLWPAGLAVFYPYPDAVPWPLALVALAGLVGVTAALVRLRAWYAVAGWAWFLLGLLPTLGLVQGGEWAAAADRHAYVAAIGILVALVWGVAELGERLAVAPRARIAVSVAAVAACGALTWRQVATWRDDVTLFTRAHETQAADAFISYGLGKALLAKNVAAGEAHLHEAIDARSRYALPYNELGRWCLRTRRFDDAARYFASAIEIEPGFSGARGDLGAALNQLGRFEEAIAVLRAGPLQPQGRFNLGVAYTASGQLDRASAEALELRALAPELATSLERYLATSSGERR